MNDVAERTHPSYVRSGVHPLPFRLHVTRIDTLNMAPDTKTQSIDQTPDASLIASLRDDAADADASITVTYPSSDGTEKRMVVSPRGTVVILNDVSEATFNQNRSASEIANQLHE